MTEGRARSMPVLNIDFLSRYKLEGLWQAVESRL